MEVVSNPHRYGQKLGNSREAPPPAISVSNPHRYGQKHGRGQLPLALSPLFQTLIGTVKSGLSQGPERGPEVSNPHRYGQKISLQRVAEAQVPVSNPHRYGQKLPRHPGGGCAGSVSNPHRYGQKVEGELQVLDEAAFQTLIGTVKRWNSSPATWPWPWFQTLIGTVKSWVSWGSKTGRSGVSNPHRYGQKGLWTLHPEVGALFQTLIGTVKSGRPAWGAGPQPGPGFKPS